MSESIHHKHFICLFAFFIAICLVFLLPLFHICLCMFLHILDRCLLIQLIFERLTFHSARALYLRRLVPSSSFFKCVASFRQRCIQDATQQQREKVLRKSARTI